MFTNLTGRERFLLLLLLPALLFGAGYQFGWRPVAARNAQLETEIAAYRQVAVQIAALGDAAQLEQPAPVAPLTSRVTQSAGAAGLQLRRLEPEQDMLRVTLENAPFAQIVLWLADMENLHAVTAAAVEIDRQTEPGIVSARFLLRGLP